MLLALTGFVMIGLLMYFLLKGKAIPVTLFVVLPIIGALINGFGIADITDYIKSGVSTTWGMAALFVFVITYFGIMTDVGMFDKLVKKLIKIANGRVLGILLVVVLVSILGHLDGNSPTTYLIVIPAMAPLCKKLNIRISTIMMVCTATITVMNLVPWGGVLNRQSITLAMDYSCGICICLCRSAASSAVSVWPSSWPVSKSSAVPVRSTSPPRRKKRPKSWTKPPQSSFAPSCSGTTSC